ncbi:MAG: sugar phosphate isomerase/epimerase family protein [Planctomycetota bacterium]
MHFDRRQALALGAGLAVGSTLPAERTQPLAISLAQWSLHRTLRSGELDNLDFAEFAKERFGIEAVEYVNQFFAERATDWNYLGEMKQRAADHGVQSLLIMIDGVGELASPDDAERRRAVLGHVKWIAAAAFLGCHAIRVNAAGDGERDEVATRAADSLVQLGTVGADYGIDVLVENHGGLSSDGGWLAGVMRRADHPRVGTLPDFGNFRLADGSWYDRYQGVAQLMPFARAVSAKSHEFDEAGNETRTDYARMLTIVRESGYEGFIGIEYEGEQHPEVKGIALTKALLERTGAGSGDAR